MIAKDCPNEGDAAEFNFLPAAARAIRQAEAEFGESLIDPLIDAVSDCSSVGSATRLFIGSLLRLVPSRQTVFESHLRILLPNWRNYLESPNQELPHEFRIASERTLREKIRLPTRLCSSLRAAAKSEFVDVAVTALKAMQRLGCETNIDTVLGLCDSPIEAVSQTAVLSISRLHRLRKEDCTDFLQAIVLDPKMPVAKRLAALEGLLSSGDSELPSKSKRLLQSLGGTVHETTWAFEYCLDVGNKSLSKAFETTLENCDVKTLPDSTCRRVARTSWLHDKLRSAAAEQVLSELDAAKPTSTRSRYGLLVQRNSSATALWIGHCGIFIGEDTLVHCTTGSDPQSVHQIGYDEWRDGLECWGIRKDSNHQVDLDRAVDRAKEIASWRTEYDGAHNNQKGEWFKGWFCSARYWEADCVGFTERVYEDVGGDPTPDEGSLLYPREQRDAMTRVMDC